MPVELSRLSGYGEDGSIGSDAVHPFSLIRLDLLRPGQVGINAFAGALKTTG